MHISSDLAITSRTEDALGRADFADRLARTIGTWRRPETLVVALQGPWGVGKTSVKNMVLETLRAAPPERSADVVEFNPWQVSGTDHLQDALLTEIGQTLGLSTPRRDGAKIRRKWSKWQSRLTGPEAVIGGIGSAVPMLLVAVAVLAGTAADVDLLFGHRARRLVSRPRTDDGWMRFSSPPSDPCL